MIMGNCTCCNPSTFPTCAIQAQMIWPGFAPFTTQGPAIDTLGVRYLNLDVTFWDATNRVLLSVSITSNAHNGTFNDTLTGTDYPELISPGDGLMLPPWPPDTITPTQVTWANGSSMTLSGPITLADVKADCQTLLNAFDLSNLKLGIDSWIVEYDTGTAAAVSNNADWLSPGVWRMEPDSTGASLLKYGWGSALSGAWYTASARGDGYYTVSPFLSAAPNIIHFPNSVDFPPGASSASLYQQEANWIMRKSRTSPVVGPTCCETDYFNYVNVPTPPTSCAMVPNAPGSNELILMPPDLAPDIRDNSHFVAQVAWFGKNLTPGGLGNCPCA